MAERENLTGEGSAATYLEDLFQMKIRLTQPSLVELGLGLSLGGKRSMDGWDGGSLRRVTTWFRVDVHQETSESS